MGRWVSASPVHTVVKGQALPIAHLLIPKKFGCEMEFEEIEISCITGEVNKLVSRFALTLAISDGVLRFPPTILSKPPSQKSQFMALDVATLLSATKAG